MSDRDLANEASKMVRNGHIAHARTEEWGDDRLLAFADAIGEQFIPVSLPPDKPLGALTPIAEAGVLSSATNWHHDQSFAETPPDWSMLYCLEPGLRQVPTVYCDGAALLSYLSAGLQDTLRTLSTDHIAYYVHAVDGDELVEAIAQHECVTDVEGGVEALFIAPATVSCFSGWSEPDSEPLLSYLFQMFNWPELTVFHRWSAGDLLIWPNRRYAHRALPIDAGSTRHLKRILGSWRAAS